MSDEPEVGCRVATADDWDLIWPIVRAVVASGDTYMYPVDLDEASARSQWIFDGARSRTYVASIGGEILGTAYVKPNHDGPGDHVANAGWMVAAGSAGKGIGRKLARFVLDDAAALGFTAMQFNAVVSTNVNAIALWESLGFRIVGTVPDAFRHPTEGPVAIHVMHRRL